VASLADREIPNIRPKSVNLTKRHIIILGVLLVVASAIWFGLKEYREHLRCATRNATFREQLEKLKNDAHDQLRIGTNKAQVVRFFEEHQMRVTFGRGEASGDFKAIGCAPFGCGADTAIVGVSVAVDSQGAVSGEPHVSGIYTDCL
jgi:hypothetical protein